MADTSYLKKVELEIKISFCEKHQLELLELSKNQVQSVFNHMEPDLVGYNYENKTLYIGEITTSGFMSRLGGDYHLGSVRKVDNAFSKFHLIHSEANFIIERLQKHIGIGEIESITCYFIVPEGCKFINALGYRERLFQQGIMNLEKIELAEETHAQMLETIKAAKNENKKQ